MSMWTAASDYDYDVECGHEECWGGRRCVRCNADITEYADESEICAACEEEERAPHAPVYGPESPCDPIGCQCGREWPCPSFAPKTALVKKVCKEMGFEVEEISIPDVSVSDLLGLPKRGA